MRVIVRVVVAAGRLGVAERLIEERTDERLGGVGGGGAMHGDFVFRKKVERAAAHATGDDDLHALPGQPARQQARLVRGRRHQRLLEHLFGGGVDLDEGELFEVTKQGLTFYTGIEPEDLVALTIEAAAMARVPLAGTSWIPGHGAHP